MAPRIFLRQNVARTLNVGKAIGPQESGLAAAVANCATLAVVVLPWPIHTGQEHTVVGLNKPLKRKRGGTP
jgi:hypothetical protein